MKLSKQKQGEKYQKAELYYKKILKIEPDFNWVKNELLPELEEKINNNE